MIDRTSSIYGNPLPKKVQKEALKKKKQYIKMFGDDSDKKYVLKSVKNDILGDILGIQNLVISDSGDNIDEKKGIIVGNIRMGFGHYRIAMAIASVVKERGYIPYWFDIPSFKDTTAGKVVNYLNHLYSLGSRLSQKFPIFNKLYWEPLNYEGFKRLSYNAVDQKVSELFAPLCSSLPKDMPFIATHVWPAQAAIHAGMKKVINMIPDNWPMALHLAEGALHTVQGGFAYLGYRVLREMDGKNKILKPIPKSDIKLVGHYVDHDLVKNIEHDCNLRIKRLDKKEAKRILISVGGAGAQKEIFVVIIKRLLPMIKDGSAVLFLNVGDHKNVYEGLVKEIPELDGLTTKHFDNWAETCKFASDAIEGQVKGVHAFWNPNIFAAVYTTNLLMRCSDVIMTKPSELAFYPIPKFFIKRVGGHEMWGAIRGAEVGDSTFECETIPMTTQVLEVMLNDDDLLRIYSENIIKMNKIGLYNGAYEIVDLALNWK